MKKPSDQAIVIELCFRLDRERPTDGAVGRVEPIMEPVYFPGQRRDPNSVLPRLRTRRELRGIEKALERRRREDKQRRAGRETYAKNKTVRDKAQQNRRAVERAARSGLSQRATARELGLARETVRKYWVSKR
jgi:hypothetical protein